MPRKRVNEEKVIYALKRLEGGAEGTGGLPGDGGKRADALQLETQVSGDGSGRIAPVEAVGGREQAFEGASGGSDPGQTDLAGGALKKSLRPVRKRELAGQVVEWFEVSCQRACGLLVLQRSSFYYRSRKKEHVALKMRLKELAMVRIRFGYPRLTVLLKREGWAVGKKLVYRLYRELGLEMRSKKRRKLASANRGPVEMATRPNERWSMDFMTDRLQSGRYFRTLTVIDQFTRECLKLEVAHHMSGARVVESLRTGSRIERPPQFDHGR
jgi:hypothetical protein